MCLSISDTSLVFSSVYRVMATAHGLCIYDETHKLGTSVTLRYTLGYGCFPAGTCGLGAHYRETHADCA
jgi:hypothetical protein